MGSPIRILHAVVNMNRGGAETLIMNLYRHIDRAKVQFDFLTCKPGVFDAEIEALGGKIHRIPHITDVGHMGYVKALNRFFDEHKPYSVIHSHMDRMSGLMLRAARRADIPIRIAHSHNTRSEGGLIAQLYKWYAGLHIRTSATHYLACSRAAARWLFAGKADTAAILHNGIACEQFAYSPEVRASIRAELHIKGDALAVGHVGRFAYQKNHSQLIDMFNRVQQLRQDSVLLLAGDGPLRATIERKVDELGLTGKVRFLGIRSDIGRLLQAFDVFAFPSLHEGLPVTLIEAQGAGLPCVISDHITPEVDMDIGLIDYFSPKDLEAGVRKILEASRKASRIIPPAALALKGYDIKQTARSAAAFYLSLSEVKNENINRVYAHL